MKPTSRFAVTAPVELTWSHSGSLYRVTTWPELQFERQCGRTWIPAEITEDICASAALGLDPAAWRRYLTFVPANVREFLELFKYGRLEVLHLIVRCSDLFADLSETPALASFVAAHASLRGTRVAGWEEISVIHDRSGVFGLLEWLGLPASRQTLTILRNVVDPDVPRRFLEPLRSLLWEPSTIFALQSTAEITDRKLAQFCHGLAA